MVTKLTPINDRVYTHFDPPSLITPLSQPSASNMPMYPLLQKEVILAYLLPSVFSYLPHSKHTLPSHILLLPIKASATVI